MGQFGRIARINGWETNKADYLWLHLAGEALSYVQGLPSAQTQNFETVRGSWIRGLGRKDQHLYIRLSYYRGTVEWEKVSLPWGKTSENWSAVHIQTSR